jgi:hypothetical protein
MDLRLHGPALDYRILFQQPWLKQLSRLTLSGGELGVEALEALADCPALAGLRSLALIGCGLRNHVRFVAASEHLHDLHELDLSNNRLDASDIACLGKGLTGLSRLVLSGNELTRQHLDALVGTGWPEGLTSLQLTGCTLSAQTISRLLTPRLEGLEELNLGGNYLGLGGAEQIASCPHLTNLRRLGLRRSGIGSQGCAALARSPHLGSLELIDTWDSGGGRSGVDKLRARFGQALWTRLQGPPCWHVGSALWEDVSD